MTIPVIPINYIFIIATTRNIANGFIITITIRVTITILSIILPQLNL